MNNMQTDISVIVPVFNRQNTIQNCINSILNQTFLPYEIIIVNDGSNDKTVDEIKEWKTYTVEQKKEKIDGVMKELKKREESYINNI